MTTSSQRVAMMRAFPLPVVYRPRKLFQATRVEETETEDEGTRKRRLEEATAVTFERGDIGNTKRPCEGPPTPLASNDELHRLYEELVAQGVD